MIKRFLKTLQKFFIFLVITGIVFSNIPFNVFTGLIDSYEKTSGIVDKIWQLEQNHKSGVVDNFSSIRNIAEKIKINDALAAAQTLYFRSNASTVVTGSTAVDQLLSTAGTADVVTTTIKHGKNLTPFQFIPGTAGSTTTGTIASTPNSQGWIWDAATPGAFASAAWTINVEVKDTVAAGTAVIKAQVWKVTATTSTVTQVTNLSGILSSASFTPSTTASRKILTFTPTAFSLAVDEYIYVETYLQFSAASSSNTAAMTDIMNTVSNTLNGSIVTSNFTPILAPTVTTTNPVATSITDTTAVFNGNITVTGGANSTSRGFDYGTDNTLVIHTTTTESGSFSTGAFTTVGSVTGLSCGTTYYARAYATNLSGTGTGTIQSFTTGACNAPPTVSLNTPTDASSSSNATPTLNFTGTDVESNSIEYNVQVDTVNTFDSQTSGTFNIQNAGAKNWQVIAIDPTTRDVYATVSGGDIYKQTGGSGTFNAQSAGAQSWGSIAIDSTTHDVYAVTYGDDIYKQTGGSGTFNAQSAGKKYWWGLAIDSTNHDVYASVDGGDIYKQTGGSGAFNIQNAGNQPWYSLAIDSTNHDVYAAVYYGDIYKQTGGSGTFNTQSAGTKYWYNMAIDSTNHDVYAVVDGGDIYKQTGGSGAFNIQNAGAKSWGAIATDSTNHDVYVVDAGVSGDIYKQTGGSGAFNTQSAGANSWWGIATNSATHDVYAFIANGDIYKQTGGGPLLSKFSLTDADFTSGHPFASGAAKDFTIQSALSPGTYYWRVAGKDPTGSNSYGAWSGTRSFTVVANNPPTVALNTPTDASSSSNTTPTLNFTGTDVESNSIEYNVQVDTVNTFDSQGGNTFDIQNSGSQYWRDIAIDSTTHDVYAVTDGGDIYKQTAGSGTFVAQNAGTQYWRGVAIDSTTHDVYAVIDGGDIYKQTAGSGNFVTQSAGARRWWRVAIDSTTHDVYVAVLDGYIYKQTGGSGVFNVQNNWLDSWYGIAIDSTTHNVYAVTNGSDIYKQTGGSGTFVTQSVGSQNWEDIAIDSTTHDVYAITYNTDVYKQTAGTGAFTALNATGAAKYWYGIAVDSTTHDVYAVVYNGDIYKQTGGSGAFNIQNAGTQLWYDLAIDSTTHGVYAITYHVDIYKKTGGGPLLDKFSLIDTGFTAGHPFASGVAKDFTVQSALADGTYYWRVAGKDPTGSNSYGAWSSTRSFTVISIVTPTLTSYTNNTDATLDSANCGTTGCGARIGGGAGFKQSVTITGTGFGADPGAGNRSALNSTVRNIKVGTHQIADANVWAWSNTSISFYTDSSVTNDTDSDWGSNYGGAGALTVTANSLTSTGLNFYVFPQITSITGGVAADQAREYDIGDSYGVINLNGTRFGTSSTGGSVSIFGQTATSTAWGNILITVQVPIAISDTVNTGNIITTQGAGSNNKTNTYTGLRILPRITSLSPTSGIVGTAVTVNGNHLCQSGTCPSTSSANDKVTFTSGINATVTSGNWSATAIVTTVPTSAVTGNVLVSSFSTPSTYTSNNKSFTVDASTTTLATGTDPSVTTIAPGAIATDVDKFTLQTNSGTETITSVTVNLSTLNGVGRIAITDNANAELGFSTSPATGSNVISVSGMSVTTSLTTFKVRVTPLSHTSMPAPAGANYSITAPVTAWAGGNTHTGSDTNTNALTIDNLSPLATTGASTSPGDTQVQVSWTNPVDADFGKVIIYCKTAAITESPTEGTDPSVDATACDGTARVKYSGSTSPQTITGLTNGTLYYFRIYARDTNGNFTAYASTQQVSATPTLTQTLTVSTVGTQATNLNSGTTAQHIGGVATAAFTLQINTGTSNVTSVKVSETGTIAMANLTNPKLYYENATSAAACAYGGAESNVSGAAPVGETVTFTLPTVAVGVTANVTCLYFVSDVTSSAVGGQTIDLQITNPSTDVTVSSGVNTDAVAKAITGTTTVRPQITGYTNSETGLNYSAACTGCGARIGGGGSMQTIVISGFGFGADPGVGNRDTATNKVEVVDVSTNLIDDIGAGNTNVTIWTNTSITITTNTAITGDADSDWGTNFGGAAALKVTSGGQAVPTNLNFYIFPQITSITVPGGFPGDSAREYDSGDSDGVLTLNGTRFGTAIGSGGVTILGSSATTTSWNHTTIIAQVPIAISDSTYTGPIVITQGTGGNGKTYSYSGFRILPRVTSLSPSSASFGDAITVNGNHLCQTGTCPSNFTVDKVTFTSAVDATLFTSWSHTAIVTAVPTGSATGNVIATSNSYTSNVSNFVLISAIPYDPTSLGQFQDSGFTQAITTGNGTNTTPIYLKQTMQVGLSGGTLYPQFEYKPVGTAFTCTTATSCVDAVEGTGVAGTGPSAGSKSIIPTDNVYHWQARTKHTRSSIDYYSAWVSYDVNAESATDFKIDTTPPVVTAVSSGSPGTNTVTITWSTSGETSTSQVQWNTTGTFVTNCATNNDCTTLDASLVNSHSVTLSNLNSGTSYYYRVRSKDAMNNEIIDTNNTFTTQIIAAPQKTIETFISGATGQISGATTYYFTVYASETSPVVKNAYVEVVVMASNTGSVSLKVNDVASGSYSVNAAVPTMYRFVYKISSPDTETNLNLNDSAPCSNSVAPGTGPKCNNIIITPTTANLNVLSAKIIINYSFTP